MGKNVIKVLVRDLESVNFDKLCRLALALRGLPFDGIEVVRESDANFDIEGDESDREYRKAGGRSMTEHYAIRTGLGTADASGVVCVESDIPGLVSLCESLAENHGKVAGVKGGGLYKRGKVPFYAKNLSVVPARASEIVGMLVKAVVSALAEKHPIVSILATDDGRWDGIDAAMSAAGQKTYEEARAAARSLQQGRYARGNTFPLAKANGSSAPMGISIVTENSQLMKHLWAAIKSMEPSFKVATAVVSHPVTKRIAVLCSDLYPVDIRPVAAALSERFPETEFDVNVERSVLVWDPRSMTPGPTPEQMQEIVSAHLGFREREKPAPAQRIGATLGDIIRQRQQEPKRR